MQQPGPRPLPAAFAIFSLLGFNTGLTPTLLTRLVDSLAADLVFAVVVLLLAILALLVGLKYEPRQG